METIKRISEFKCDKYKISYKEDNYIIGESSVYDYRKYGYEFIIIESDNLANPTNYTEYVYKELNISKDITVILDLSNLYGMSNDSIYNWIFEIEDDELQAEDFIALSNKRFNILDIFSKAIKNYLHEKFYMIRAINVNII